jgi:hypothetical protein
MIQALGVLAESGSEHESGYGYLFIAFRPDLVGSADVFKRRVTQLIERIKATPRQPGVDDIRIPSERAFRSRERALRDGLEIDRLVFDAPPRDRQVTDRRVSHIIRAKERGADHVEISVHAFSEDAMRAYTTAGFQMSVHRLLLRSPFWGR